MTSITSFNRPTPLQLLQKQLTADISAGTVQASDQSALSDALSSIDASMAADRASVGDQQKPPSAADIKSKIDSLIQGQVDSGKLTADQATELKNLFSEVFSSHGKHRHHGGPKPTDDLAAVAGAGDSTSSSTTSDDLGKLVQNFLKSIGGSQTAYGADGAASSIAQLSSVLLNFKV